MKRPAIVDAYHDAPSVRDVGHSRVGRQGQGRMRGGHGVHVVGLACRGFGIVEFLAVPRGDAALLVRTQTRRWHVVTPEDRVRPVCEAIQCLETRRGIGNCVEIGGRIVSGPVVLIIAAAALRSFDSGGSGRCLGRSRCRTGAEHQRRERQERTRQADTRARPRSLTGGSHKHSGYVFTSLRFACTLIRIPSPMKRLTSAVPPKDISGSGTPTMGRSPLTIAMLTKA